MNTDLFIGFMGRLIADSKEKVFLILDNLKVHHAKLVTAWSAEGKDQIEVFYLLPYSPEINPDEYLNRDFKTVLRTSDRAPNKKVLLQKATTFMEFLSKKRRNESWLFQTCTGSICCFFGYLIAGLIIFKLKVKTDQIINLCSICVSIAIKTISKMSVWRACTGLAGR